MIIFLNGQNFEVPPTTTLAGLIQLRQDSGHLRTSAYAVERNKEVVIRPQHESTRLAPNDKIEIVNLTFEPLMLTGDHAHLRVGFELRATDVKTGKPAESAGKAVRRLEGVQLKSIIAQALQMGDECHNRNVAATSLLARMLARALVQAVQDREAVTSARSHPLARA